MILKVNVLVTRMNIADGAPDTYLRTESQTLQGVDQELVDAGREVELGDHQRKLKSLDNNLKRQSLIILLTNKIN